MLSLCADASIVKDFVTAQDTICYGYWTGTQYDLTNLVLTPTQYSYVSKRKNI